MNQQPDRDAACRRLRCRSGRGMEPADPQYVLPLIAHRGSPLLVVNRMAWPPVWLRAPAPTLQGQDAMRVLMLNGHLVGVTSQPAAS